MGGARPQATSAPGAVEARGTFIYFLFPCKQFEQRRSSQSHVFSAEQDSLGGERRRSMSRASSELVRATTPPGVVKLQQEPHNGAL